MTNADKIANLAAVIANQQSSIELHVRTRELQDKLFAEHQARIEELQKERDDLISERDRANHALEKALTQTVSSKITRKAFRESYAKWMGKK